MVISFKNDKYYYSTLGFNSWKSVYMNLIEELNILLTK